MPQDDIVDRLQAIADNLNDWDHPINGKADIADAIAEITRLRAQVEAVERIIEQAINDEIKWGEVGPFEMRQALKEAANAG